MKVQCEEKGRSLIVTIEGDIDHHTTDGIRGKIDKSFERSNAKNIIVDFEKVNFMDSSGIGMLIGRYKMIENKGGGHLISANMSQSVYRLFEISGLQKIIKYAANVDEALLLAER